MKLFKLVNKTNKTMIPESYNEYTSVFKFNQRVTNLHLMTTLDDVSLVDPSNIAVSSGRLTYMGDIKTNLETFKLYLENTTQTDNIIPTWKDIMASGFCNREAELVYLKHHNLNSYIDTNTLVSMAVDYKSHTCLEYLMLYGTECVNLEEIIKNRDLSELFEDIEFVKVALNYLSDDFIMNIDVAKVTENHRYAEVRKYIKKLKLHINNIKL